MSREPTISLKDADFAGHGCDIRDIDINPGIELVEIEVTPITRYVVKRYVHGRNEKGVYYGGSRVIGEFDNPQMADQVSTAMEQCSPHEDPNARMRLSRRRRSGMSLGEVLSGQRLSHTE